MTAAGSSITVGRFSLCFVTNKSVKFLKKLAIQRHVIFVRQFLIRLFFFILCVKQNTSAQSYQRLPSPSETPTPWSWPNLKTVPPIASDIEQLDAQMFIHLLKSSTCFEQYRAYPQEVK
jgi:hypothetical protein